MKQTKKSVMKCNSDKSEKKAEFSLVITHLTQYAFTRLV